MPTQPLPTTRERRPHLEVWIAEYVADRLDSRSSRALETHALVCDLCFAALLAGYLFPAAGDPPGRTA